ncbi:M35 family metallo-endopeptidase [Calidithermus chliarophilus]|uniref:M35 family metallo-endopeptidase n=1 Tax=Calidithermus chliarophilus TaxID=52023 RepID=UPI0012F6BA48|nr:M35 family metallo-endopeptidase [Calidithermus chliarophilus]
MREALRKPPAPRPGFRPAARDARSQRRCACGGVAGPTGECEQCRERRLRNAGRDSAPAHSFGRVEAGVPRRPVRVPGGPANSFEDCPADWRRQANAAVELGRQWVANVLLGLNNLPSPIPAPVANLLNRHFHTTYSGDIRAMLRVFGKVQKALEARIDFECETRCDDNVAAYVYTIWTDVHLCPVWYGQNARGKANTIVHELAHDAAGRDDKAYVWEARYARLSVDEALDNADSYSCFAEDAFYGP